MEQEHGVRNVNKSAFGDFIDFDLRVVDSWRQCRISGTALVMLGSPAKVSGLKAFELYEARIGQIAASLSTTRAGGGRLAIISSDI
ncbi:hypothetical protein GTP46_17785 [Duganella sp. FT135W]|uniref:DUF1488 family protein n=1 Tax=Duganella flavida TaxID=2692175 RepID=A0A6L8KE70_9BURK|nr:hypothetical protein [Duganella flavida]MYM24498.1 hypothetical protein [Duganella flavida]